MRLFGVPSGTLDQERSTFGFLAPFDLPLNQPAVFIGRAINLIGYDATDIQLIGYDATNIQLIGDSP